MYRVRAMPLARPIIREICRPVYLHITWGQMLTTDLPRLGQRRLPVSSLSGIGRSQEGGFFTAAVHCEAGATDIGGQR